MSRRRSTPADGGGSAVGDLPPPRLITPRGAFRRSLLVWGWGQVATGDRRGYAWAMVELVALAAIVLVGWPLTVGPAAGLVFLAGVVFVATWAGLAFQAYQRAARRREALGLSGADGGTIDILWLAPILIAISTFFWTVAGAFGSPDAAVARYATWWRHERAADASMQFYPPLDPSGLAAIWTRQDARLQNELIRLAANLGPESGITPSAPFDSLRFETAVVPGAAGDRFVTVEVVRRASVRDSFFGLFPTTSQRLEPVDQLGAIELQLVNRGPSGRAVVGGDVWLIKSMDLLGERIGG